MNKKLIITFAIFFITFLLITLLIFPKYQDFQLLKMKVKSRELENKNLSEYYSQIEKISEELKQYQEALSKIDTALPREFFFPSLLSYLQKISSQSGLYLTDFGGVSSNLTKKNFHAHSFNITLVGSYYSLKSFLPILEKSARMIDVESISFGLSKEQNFFNFNLKLKAYSY